MGIKIVEPVPGLVRLREDAVALARRTYHEPGRAAFRRRLDCLPVPERGSLRLNFGWIQPPERENEASIGGGVKLIHLRERFGEVREGFNVVYLVSSLLHLIPHVAELVTWAKARRIAVVWNQNGVAYPAWCGSHYPWFNEPMRRLIAQADQVVYQSAFCRDCADRYLGPVAAPAEVLWNPVDLAHFTPAGQAAPTNVWELLAMGTSHAFYRVRASLDALAALMRRGLSARLTIAGELRWEGGDREVADYIRQAGLQDHVRLLPRFTQADAPALYQRAHVLLHPKYKDPCPTVPIEAMACGLPVVGSRSGGMPELVGEDGGMLVDVPDSWTRDHAPDAERVADAVAAIMGRHGEFSLSSRRRAEACFDRTKWVDWHAEIFAQRLGL